MSFIAKAEKLGRDGNSNRGKQPPTAAGTIENNTRTCRKLTADGHQITDVRDTIDA